MLPLVITLALLAPGTPTQDQRDAASIVEEMVSHGENCTSIENFLMDTALDVDFDLECSGPRIKSLIIKPKETK